MSSITRPPAPVADAAFPAIEPLAAIVGAASPATEPPEPIARAESPTTGTSCGAVTDH